MNLPPELFLIAMFVLMYFLLIRPQQKRAKDHKTLLKALKKGDEVVTNGGVIGKITAVDESFAEVEVASGVVVKLQKQGINQKMPKGSAKSMSKSSSKASSKAKASPKEKLTEKKETKK
ncbi:preprotein translocase subunit YajC [Candidatus Thioglobus sp.]|mgnify:FL=1|jgi:preprotein translocase subunit YajC|nr:preprotein translocase subunit YajC [Candidatus Thioglobus sp.]MDC1447140.1 preprotein translocase subunit YajC [Candidatus Thioglobus sp.]